MSTADEWWVVEVYAHNSRLDYAAVIGDLSPYSTESAAESAARGILGSNVETFRSNPLATAYEQTIAYVYPGAVIHRTVIYRFTLRDGADSRSRKEIDE